MGLNMIVPSDLKTLAPRMSSFYRDVLLSEEGQKVLADAGILDNGRRLAHFFGQCAAETGGFTIVRESLTYTTVKRIKEVWPARAKKATEADLKKLVRNPVALGDWAYGGRMGNRKGTIDKPHRDGYDYRGGGWLQCTGRGGVQRLCDLAKIEMRPGILDDPLDTLKLACAEWVDSGCNELADANDLLGISKAINTGSATSNITPVGMEHRTAWFEKAKRIWWDEELGETVVRPVPAPPPVVAAQVKDTLKGSRTIFSTLSAAGAFVVYIYHETIEVILAAAAQFDALAPAAKILSALGISVAGIAIITAFASLAGAIFARLDDTVKGKVVN